MRTTDKYELGYNETLKKDIQEANKKVNAIIRLSKSFLCFFNNKQDVVETNVIESKIITKLNGDKNATK